ncbi:hypothetical protein CK203_020162 [Vitis vinifera]|uniref:Uncharacterized protein n=1 Tax=Vitis vinifera TaxID=29760 RepID=A0A438J834_VITVI|nr:hypothetical protein CK203_020162 [Vitis vinifera]
MQIFIVERKRGVSSWIKLGPASLGPLLEGLVFCTKDTRIGHWEKLCIFIPKGRGAKGGWALLLEALRGVDVASERQVRQKDKEKPWKPLLGKSFAEVVKQPCSNGEAVVRVEVDNRDLSQNLKKLAHRLVVGEVEPDDGMSDGGREREEAWANTKIAAAEERGKPFEAVGEVKGEFLPREGKHVLEDEGAPRLRTKRSLPMDAGANKRVRAPLGLSRGLARSPYGPQGVTRPSPSLEAEFSLRPKAVEDPRRAKALKTIVGFGPARLDDGQGPPQSVESRDHFDGYARLCEAELHSEERSKTDLALFKEALRRPKFRQCGGVGEKFGFWWVSDRGALDAYGSAGGLLICWDKRTLEVLEMEVGKFSISCRFRNMEDGLTWIFTGVYGPFSREDRDCMWEELGAIRGLWDDPWCLGELLDLPLQRGAFTWSGGRNNQSWARLDRALPRLDLKNIWFKVDDFKVLLRGGGRGLSSQGSYGLRKGIGTLVFFHRMANAHHRNNSLDRIMTNGEWLTEDQEEAEVLELPFTEEEIHFALMEMKRDKASGPDGFTCILASLLGFCEGGALAKVLVNRLKKVLERVVSVDQNAFVRGRQILDASLIANEGLQQGDPLSPYLFVLARKEQLTNLSWILAWFKVASGLRINLAKSVLIPIGEVDELEVELQCRLGALPTVYLGLPLGAHHKASSTWDGVEERMRRRLAQWKRQYISKVKRLPLGGKLGGKAHLINWEVVCNLKEEGGLGIRKIDLLNKALLGKWIWRYAYEKDNLWKRVIGVKYGQEGCGWRTKEACGSFGVGVWKEIMKEANWCWESIEFKVGKGTRVMFWTDKWCGNAALSQIFPQLFTLAVHRNAMVNEVWDSSLGQGGWNLRFAKDFNDWELDQIRDMFNLLRDFRTSPEEDSVS